MSVSQSIHTSVSIPCETPSLGMYIYLDLRDLLEEVIDEQGFKNIYKLIEKLRVDAETQKTCLETSAAQYCNHDSPSSGEFYMTQTYQCILFLILLLGYRPARRRKL